MIIDKYKLKLGTFTAELGELDRDQRLIIQTEAEIHSVETQDNGDGTFDQVYKAKVVGATETQQGGVVVKGKSKRRNSQKLRAAIWNINPSEDFYDWFFDSLLMNLEETIDALKEKYEK